MNFVPESVLRHLTVGQRVRYTPDKECNYQPYSSSYSAKYGAKEHEAHTHAEGKIGTIISINDRLFEGHPYRIKMDEWYEFGGKLWLHVLLAAYELTLVEEE